MAGINSIIEMIEKNRNCVAFESHKYERGYNEACDDIIEQLRKMEDKEPELRRCLKSLVEVTKHLNLCPGVMSECEDILKQ